MVNKIKEFAFEKLIHFLKQNLFLMSFIHFCSHTWKYEQRFFFLLHLSIVLQFSVVRWWLNILFFDAKKKLIILTTSKNWFLKKLVYSNSFNQHTHSFVACDFLNFSFERKMLIILQFKHFFSLFINKRN